MNKEHKELPQSDNHPDDVTLGEFVMGLVEILRWVKGHFWQLVLATIIGVGLMIFLELRKEPQYQASLTFMLADDHSGQVGGISSMLGQFGIPISSGKYNIDKLLEIAKSRKIVQEVILSSAEINGATSVIGNTLIETYELDERWAENEPGMEGFRFDNASDLDGESLYALKSLHHLLVGSPSDRSSGLIQMDYGSMDYIMSFATTTLIPDLSIALSDNLYEHLKAFYISKATEKTQASYDLIAERRDSIVEEYKQIEYQIASLKDRSLTSFQNVDNIRLSNLTSESFGLKIAIQEIEKSLSLAELSLKSSTPLIQKIDDPSLPISPLPKSWLKIVIIGALIGIVLYFLGVFAYTVLRMV